MDRERIAIDERTKRAIGIVEAVWSDDGREAVLATAFLVSHSHVLTSFHAVGDRRAFNANRSRVFAHRIQFTPSGTNQALPLRVVPDCVDEHADWVLLELESPSDITPIQLGNLEGSDESGARGFVCWGYPFGATGTRTGVVAQGHVKDWKARYEDAEAIELHCDLAASGMHTLEGMSGAPCIVDGEVVGILRANLLGAGPGVVGATVYACPITQLNAECRQHLPPREPTVDQRIGELAHAQKPHFTGRSHELLRIHQALNDRPRAFGANARRPDQPVKARPVIIRGMPGMGKTTLAREYAIRHVDSYDHMHMLNAESREALVASMAALAVAKGVAHEDTLYEAAAERFVEMLKRSKQRWLLIFDNATDQRSIDSKWWPPAHVAMVITTRWAAWGKREAAMVELQQLGETEAVQFLLSRSGRRDDAEGAHRLYGVLGGVALALEQAAALCDPDEEGWTFSECVEQVKGVLAYDEAARSDVDRSVLATMAAAMKVATAKCPSAPRLLALIAYCDPEAIPASLLAACMGDEKLANEALKTLRSLSLIAIKEGSRPGARTVSAHRLVQEVARTWARDDGTEDRVASGLVTWLLGQFPKKGYEDHETWPDCRLLAPHALRLWELKGPQVVGVDACELMDHVAMYLLGRSEGGADLERAESLFRQMLMQRDPLEATRPWALALTLSNLALVLHYRGQYTESLKLCERALEIRERKHDPKLAWSVNNKAFLLKDMGRLDEALELMQLSLKLTVEANPPESLDEWAVAYDNLGDVQLEMGLVDEAVASFDQGLAYRRTYYAKTPEHSDIAYSLYHIAKARFQLGQVREAIELCDAALAIYRKTLRPDHIDGAEVLEFAGELRVANDQPTEAERFFRDGLAVFDAALTPDHSGAVSLLQRLAELLAAKGEFTESIGLLEQARDIHARAHGQHSDEACSSDLDLADLLLRAGQKGRARDVAVRVAAALQVAQGSAELLARATALIEACKKP